MQPVPQGLNLEVPLTGVRDVVPGVKDASHLVHGGGHGGLLGGLHRDLVEVVAGTDAVADNVAASGVQRHDRGVVKLLAVALHHTDDPEGHMVDPD